MHIIALDIGGTNVRVAIVNEDGSLLHVLKEPTIRNDRDAFITQIIAIINKTNFTAYAPIGISIGVPGRVRNNGFIDALPNIGITDIDLISALREVFHLPVVIRNDAEMACFAEAKLGAGRNYKSTYFVTISTGIGGCLVVNDEIKNPSNEIGHTLFHYKNGFYELERIASGEGVVQLAALNNVFYPNGKAFFTDVANKVPYALPIFNDWLDLIVAFFTYINDAFTPDIITLTGGVLKSKDIFFAELTRRIPTANIALAHFSEDAGLIGAASYGFTKYTPQ